MNIIPAITKRAQNEHKTSSLTCGGETAFMSEIIGSGARISEIISDKIDYISDKCYTISGRRCFYGK